MSVVIENLSFTYMPGTPYEKRALQDITLSIREGEFVGLIGATGSGKSTLIQHINGLVKLQSGKLRVFGIDLSARKIDYKLLRKGIGMLFQYPEYQLFDETVLRDVMFGPKNFGMSEAHAYESAKRAIELAGLSFDEIKDRSPFELSGGQKRRVAIAGVLAYNPEILILDEPTAGLDPVGKRDILELITKLKGGAIKTIIMISHNMDEIAAYTDRIIVLDSSRLVYDLTPAELFEKKDELPALGLDLPTTVKIKNLLAEKGFHITEPALDIASLYAQIISKLGGRHE
ncbi:MAG: energy-coupling factor transporter ATPase [Clostridia bacterium]|nr:energy-coupling factor transporter ATPase [Clostridia bacterium]